MNEKYHPHKIFQYCPKCGKKSLLQINERAQECTNCRFLFYINAAAAVAGIIENEQNEVLFTKRAFDPAKGMLDLPGGFVDPSETAEQALEREIKEELNIELENFIYFGSYPNRYIYRDLLYYTLDMIFLCKVKSFKNIQAADDISSFEFRTPHINLVDQIGLESIKQVVKSYLAHRNK